jgi:hypothetical protein
MNDNQTPKQTWFQRFSASGWLSLCLTLIAAPFVYYLIHYRFGIDWFYTAILGAILSVLSAHVFLLPVVLVLIRLLAPATFCAVCPACGERALVVGMRISEPTEDPRLRRVYQLADCRRCHKHFHRLNDGSYDEQPQNA